MKILLRCLLPLCVGSLSAQESVWLKLSHPTAAEVAKNFANPPAEYSSQITWGWSGVISREVIARDLDHMQAMNIHQAWVEPGRNPEAPYLSAAYFANVKIAVEEAKKRHMFLWFDDDGGYPSGFAGGKFTNERPELRMKALAPAEQVSVENGQEFSRAVDEQTICTVALNLDSGATQVLEPKNGKVSWTAPASGRWAVAVVRWVYRSGVTRSANNKSGAKDNEHSLMDYLAPAANQAFIQWTFEAYKQAVGDEFGKTFLGFRGDEAAYGFNPWTPDLPAEFQKRKGYDLRPYLPAVSAIQIGRGGRGAPAAVTPPLDAAHRAFADYCDVWSDLFGENFFAADGAWCAANRLVLQHHIEHEEILPQLAIANGDFFKCMRGVQVPGVDVIWHQLWHDVVADFPKLASSATHLNGHPQAMSETFAAMGGQYPTPNLEECSWILNHQIALGITHFEYMFMRASTPMTGRGPGGPPPAGGNNPAGRRGAAPAASPASGVGVAPAGYRYLNDPKFPDLAAAVNRATYVLAQGVPAAQIGVYIPSSSFWFGDAAPNKSFLAIVHALLEHQRDLDFVDDDSLARTLELKGAELVNRSGQGYRAIIVPPATAISQAALDRLQTFAKAGGKVIFLGGMPGLVAKQNFLAAVASPQVGWATVEPTPEITASVLSALPKPDVALDRETPGLKYNHRRLRDADVYFFFNEGLTAVEVKATVASPRAAKVVQAWDPRTGQTAALADATVGREVTVVPLKLEPWATTLVVVAQR